MQRAPRPEGRPTPTASRRSTLGSASRHMSSAREAMAKRSRGRYGGTSFLVTCRTVNRALLQRARSAHAKQMRTARAARILIVLVVVACAPTPTAKLPVTCGATAGGHAGAETQLRFVEASDTEIVLTFNGESALTLETISDAVGGAPIGTPVQGSGAGYEPSSKISITIGGRLVWETTANADGTFDSGFWIPDREPGLYTVTATDGHGHVGTTTLRVMAQRTKK